MNLPELITRLKKWHIITLLGFISICLVAGAYLYYNSEKERVRRDKIDDLQTITTFKVNQITQWYRERLSEAKYFSTNENFLYYTKNILKNKNIAESKSYFTSRLEGLRKNHNYKNIYIASLDDEIIFTLDPDHTQIDTTVKKLLYKDDHLKNILFTDFYFCNYHNEIHYDIIAPIFDENKSILAYLIFKVDPDDYLYPLIQSWPVPSKSAETLIYRKEKDKIVFLNNVRHTNNERLQLSVPFSKKEVLAIQGAMGKTGISEGKDYRNEDVLGDLHPIPGTNWFMVAKIDKSEVYEELGTFGFMVFIITGVIILLIGSGVMLMFKYNQSNLYKEMYFKEKNLNETREEFKTTLYSIGDGVISTDTLGNIVRMNIVAENLTGWKESEAKGKYLCEVFQITDEKSGNKLECPVRISLETGVAKKLTNNTLLISKTNTRIPVAYSSSPVKSDNGEIHGAVLVFRDETKERNSKNLLRESEAKFSSIFHFSPIAIVIAKVDGTIIDVNDLFLEVTGYSKNESIGKTPLEIGLYNNPQDREKFVGALLQNGYVPKMEMDFKMKSGEIKTCYISGELVKIDKTSFIISTILDISDQKLIQSELINSQEKLSSTLELAKMGYWEYDVKTDQFTFNDQLYKMLRTSVEKEGGYTMSSGEYSKRFIHPDDLDMVVKRIKESIKSKSPDYVDNHEHRIIFADGNTGTLSVTAHTIKNENGETVKTFGFNQDITERIKTEEAVNSSEKKFATAFHTSPDSININRLSDGLYLEVNEGFCKITGFTPEEVTGKTSLEIKIWADHEDRNTLVRKLLDEGEVNNFEANFRKKDGTLLTGLMSARIIKLNDTDCILTITRDITERKKAEDSLRLFRTLIDQSTDIIQIVDPVSLKFLDINENGCLELGYKREEIPFLKVEDIHPHDSITREKILSEFDKNGFIVLESFYKRKNGSVFPVEVNLQYIHLDKGYVIGIARDITERKEAEEKIRKLSRGVEQSPSAIVITDTKGNIEYVNPKFTEVTGYSFEEAIGKNPSILKSDNTTLEEYRELWETITNKKEWRGNFLNKKKSGELFWESASISPILNKKGEITNFIAVKEDITEMKKINDELITAKEKAEEMNRIKSYFYANISHELRTPFVGIMGFAELLRDQLKDPEEKEMAEVILNSSRRLTETLNKILDITKLEFDKAEINIQKVNIVELLTGIKVLYSKTAAQYNTEIKTRYHSDKIIIKTDEAILQEILNNLVNNAVKFTNNGLIELSTDIIEKGEKRFLGIKVKDNGIGIPREKQELIWMEFRQASEGLSRTFEGTGLGLSITKKYTQLLNGEIYLESEPNKGSAFTIILPLVEDSVHEEKIIAEPLYEAHTVKDLKKDKFRILYVEDDKVSRSFVNKILSGNYELEEASNAVEALNKIKNNKYNLLLIDINLGLGINGIELTQKIRQMDEYKNIPVVAVTAFASANDRKEFLEKGFSHYISKPFSSGDLQDLIKTILKEEKV